MQGLTTDLQSLIARIEKLERQNRRFKRGGLAILLAAATLIGMGQGRPTRSLEAEQFILKDAQGRPRLVIGTPSISGAAVGLAPDEPAIWLDRDKSHAVLTSDGLGFSNEKGTARLDSTDSGPTLRFFNYKMADTLYLSPLRFEMNGESNLGPNIFLDDAGGFPRVSLGLIRNRPSIIVNDAQGFSTQMGSIDLETIRTGEKHNTSAASIALLGKDGKVLWSAP
jgi:hypothetical protein